jgi:hypothetical protein
MKMRIVLISLIGLLLASCGKSNENEYAISRLADMITLYWVLPANSEIANFELKDNVLELDIDMDKQRVTRNLSIPIGAWQQKSIAIIENHETLEVKGISRLNELAIFHIMAHPTMEAAPEFPFKTHIMWKSIDGKWQESPQIVPSVCVFMSSQPDRYLRNLGDNAPGNFTQAEIFRSGDRITAYWHSPGKPRTTWFNHAQAESGYIGGGIGEKGIGLPDNWIEQMPIAKIEPHESVTCLGVGKTPEIFIAYFRVSSNATN